MLGPAAQDGTRWRFQDEQLKEGSSWGQAMFCQYEKFVLSIGKSTHIGKVTDVSGGNLGHQGENGGT